ncbi:MAG TPA: SDR family NAD(P)-dependent oxidoreductase [Solirubrobacteraceae bacterium]|jgi:NAD(P)-dependent dehydrogenase (short-subunit alcohol dehydrogenase family)
MPIRTGDEVRLDSSAALVSGGASGLGRATAEALRAQGAEVVILDLAQAWERVAPDGFEFAAADVRDAEAVGVAVAKAASLAPLRVAVNCAGIGTAGRVVRKGEPMALEQFANTIEINLIGTFNVIRLAAAAMAATEPIEGGRGVIVNTASVAAFDGQIGQAAYSASKGGIVGMTLPIARDLASSAIRCVTIAPGIFDTPMLAELPQPARDSLGASVPHPARLGDPAEYAALVAHIVANDMLNGEVIRLDGALRMGPR